MFALLLKVAEWTARNVLFLIPTIILTLAVLTPVAAFLRGQYEEMVALETQLQELADVVVPEAKIDEMRADLEKDIERAHLAVALLNEYVWTAASETLNAELERRRDQVATLREKLSQVTRRIEQRRPLTPLALFPNPRKAVEDHVRQSAQDAKERAKLELQIVLIDQEIDFLERVKGIKEARANLEAKRAECRELKQRWLPVWRSYAKAYATYEKARRQGASGLGEVLAQLNQTAPVVQRGVSDYTACNRAVADAESLGQAKEDLPSLVLDPVRFQGVVSSTLDYVTSQTDDARRAVDVATQELRDKLGKNFLYGLLNSYIKPVIGTAVVIWLCWLILPKAYRFVLHQFLAPIATRQKPIQLVPEAEGKESLVRAGARIRPQEGAESAVVLPLHLGPTDELLALPSYLHSIPTACRTETRWVLDRDHLGISIVSGLYNLEAVSAPQGCEVILSSGEDVLAELALLDVPAGSAISLRAGHVTAVVHKAGSAMTLDSQWKWGHMQSWLTLQFRYLTFHGPLKLVVKGGKGVHVAKAGGGVTIPQRSTIGFSANVLYSTKPTEALWPYLLGHAPLLRDKFDGSSGVYVYEAMPTRAGAAGIVGRGPEAMMDAVLKAVGV